MKKFERYLAEIQVARGKIEEQYSDVVYEMTPSEEATGSMLNDLAERIKKLEQFNNKKHE